MSDVPDAPQPARIALISDVHANLPALEEVSDDIDRRGVDGIYHVGDLVGYAPWPDETVALLRDRNIPGVAGNYDSTVATRGRSTAPTTSAAGWRRMQG